MPSVTMNIPVGSELHRKIQTALLDRHKLARQQIEKTHDRWRRDEEKFIAYLPERDVDLKKRARREGGKPEYTTIVLPYSYAMLMTAHTYWTTVFLGRNPVMQFAGRHGEPEQKVQALEALMDYQVQVGKMLVPLYIWLLDVGKYGVGLLTSFWDEEIAYVSEIVNQPITIFGFESGRTKKRKITRRISGYQGNKLTNVRPYNFFPDPRVPLHRFQDGEFCGMYVEVGWNEIKRREAAGFYMNVDRLPQVTRSDKSVDQGSGQIDIPDIEHNDLEVPGAERLSQRRKEANFFGLYDYFVELIPEAWGLGTSPFPEKWVFTASADFTVIIGARPLAANHDSFPFHMLQYEPEGYGFTSRSMMEVLEPIQHTMDWLINSHFYNVRKALNHQLLVDPSRVVMKDILEGPIAGNVIRIKPAAYGTNAREAIQELPFQDVTRGHIADIDVMHQFGQRMVGVNDQLMGILQQGGRRSATEFRGSAQFGINRLKTQSEFFSALGWSEMSQMLVQNTQQYFDRELSLRLVGDLAIESGPNFLDVSPDAITGFYDWVPVDGTLPIDRFQQANLWRELFAQIARIPEIAGQYDLARIFAFVAQLTGLKNVHRFRAQVVPDNVAAQQAQRGNVVPLAAGTQPDSQPQPQQVPGQGATI